MEKIDAKEIIENLPKPNLKAGEPNTTPKYDPEEVWKIVLENLKMILSERDLKVWYTGIYIEKIENGVVELSSDNHIKREWIESNHRNLLRNKVEEVLGYKPDLVINIRSSLRAVEDDGKYQYYSPNSPQASEPDLFNATQYSSNQQVTQPTIAISLNPKYTLENFVVGSGNQLAYAVCEGVINNPGSAYNPVFFYGPSGVGKTHLMQAIGNAILKRTPNAKIVYVPIETFMNDFIEAIRTRKNEEFRNKYRSADLLIIDDIQFLSTFKKTKEEVFNTFNALYQANKQIVIASDRPPKEIENLPDRLRTRFEGGMVVDIQSPDFETRVAILKQKVRDDGVDIPNEILIFIAQKLEGSVRELDGAITKVATSSKLLGKLPTIDEVAKMLQVDIDSRRKRVKPENIIESVCEIFDLQQTELLGRRRTSHVALARQVVMYLLRTELEYPLDRVARLVRRKDHTTVLHACDKIQNLINTDERMKNKVDKCRILLQE